MSISDFHSLVNGSISALSSLKGQVTISASKYRSDLEKIVRAWVVTRESVIQRLPAETLGEIDDSVSSIRDELLPRREILRKTALRELKKIDGPLRPIALIPESPIEQELIIFEEDQTYTALNRLMEAVRDAKNKVLVADSYVNEKTLRILSEISGEVAIKILFKEPLGKFYADWPTFQREFKKAEARENPRIHDRLLIIDGEHAYFSGPSIKDAGKKPGVVAHFTGANCSKLEDLFNKLWEQGSPYNSLRAQKEKGRTGGSVFQTVSEFFPTNQKRSSFQLRPITDYAG